MYGESATELIRHITRDKGETIPAYQYELVERVMRENDELYAENLKTSQTVPAREPDSNGNGNRNGEENAQGDEAEPVSEADREPDREESITSDNIDLGEKEIMVMQVRHTAKLWNKRCIIAYHHERLSRLKKLRWEYGNNLPKEIVQNLSKDELEWFTKYNDNLFTYMSSLNGGKGLDLTLYVHPPKKLYIQVKCIKDYGQFDLDNGQPVMLKKDSIHFLPLSQCEKLIHQGVLEQTSL